MRLWMRVALLVVVGLLLAGSGVAYMAITAPPKPGPELLAAMQARGAGKPAAQTTGAKATATKAGASCAGEEGSCSGGSCSLEATKAKAAPAKAGAKDAKPAAASARAAKPAAKK